MNPIVIARHLIWTVYGSWLPNDPRGSGSKEVRRDVIAELGKLRFGRKMVRPFGQVVRQFYREAAECLQHPLLTFDQDARSAIAKAFSEVIEIEKFTCYACVIMPDHVHILIRKHRHQAEEMIAALKESSKIALNAAGSREADHPVWTGGTGWKVFLELPDEVRRTIGYIEKNPDTLGLPRQVWPFVKIYDGWPLHPGHSPNSSYARRLRDIGRYP